MKLEQVFGGSTNVASYVRRENIDDELESAIRSRKQIVIYGSSKQGKSTLLQKYIQYDNDKENANISYNINSKTTLGEIYKFVLKDAGVKFHTTYNESNKELMNKVLTDDGGQEEVNIEQPQQVATLLKATNKVKIIILENFHYLQESMQKVFASDLRVFHDLGIRFIVLGVWRAQNKLTQYNGDLLDRVKEIPVEPWENDDFFSVAQQGSKLLNIEFCEKVLNSIINMSCSSIGVFQDLLHAICLKSNVGCTQEKLAKVDNIAKLDNIYRQKATHYSTRHSQALKAIASHGTNTKLNLSYYIVQTILHSKIDDLEIGLSSKKFFDFAITNVNDLEIRYVKSALHGLSAIQSEKEINPSIIFYDNNSDLLLISDSTIFFWLKNSDIKLFSSELSSLYNIHKK